VGGCDNLLSVDWQTSQFCTVTLWLKTTFVGWL
jgi:hypothetical protein